MTDKEKVIQLLLDNSFTSIGSINKLYQNNDMSGYVTDEGTLIYLSECGKQDEVVLYSYLELIGFLYLKYGKVYISEK